MTNLAKDRDEHPRSQSDLAPSAQNMEGGGVGEVDRASVIDQLGVDGQHAKAATTLRSGEPENGSGKVQRSKDESLNDAAQANQPSDDGHAKGPSSTGSPEDDSLSDDQPTNHGERDGGVPEANRTLVVSGWVLFTCVLLLTAVVTIIATVWAVSHPRTDDAEVFANFIGVAPQVDGPIVQMSVTDNQQVHAGDLLFVIDERPYRYALDRALSNQKALEGQVENERRHINSQISGVHVATASIYSSASNRDAMSADIDEARADLANAQAAIRRDEADLHYAEDNLRRLEPLLVQEFVTVDEVDKARTLVEVRRRTVQQALAQIASNEAHIQSKRSLFQQSSTDVDQRVAQRDQAANEVESARPLTNQREDRSAAVKLAQYNLDNCRVYAPFDGYITNLTTSLGAYVHTGSQVFTMIDGRAWWVIANFRETQLSDVLPGSPADVFLMEHSSLPLHGKVESIGFGVTPDPSVAGQLAPGLPSVERTLSWVHLAARYPVRIRIDAPPPNLLRIGQTAVAIVRSSPGPRR